MFQTLADELRKDDGQPRDVAARPGKGRDELGRHRITGIAENNWERPGCLLGSQGGGSTSGGHEDIDLERDQLGCQGREPVELCLRISVFDHEVATLDVPEILQSLTERLDQGGVRAGAQVAYSSDLGRLLPLGERRGEEAASKRAEECPAVHHSIT